MKQILATKPKTKQVKEHKNATGKDCFSSYKFSNSRSADGVVNQMCTGEGGGG